MNKFDYQKWKYSHTAGMSTTGLITEQMGTGSATGSATGSNTVPTGSSTGSCVVHPPAQAAVSSNPQLGDHGITQQFVNNMQGKPTAFYNQRATAFVQKAIQLNGGTGQMLCKGKNPMWQAQLLNRQIYAYKCGQNPGSC